MHGLIARLHRLEDSCIPVSAEIQIDSSRLGSLGLGDLLNAGFEDDDVKVQTDIEILQSETVAMAALAALPPAEQRAFAGFPVDFEHPEKLTPAERDASIGKLGSKLKCKRVPNTQIVQVSFRDPDPQLAKDVANNVVDAFVKGTFQSRYKSVEQVSGWLSDQMKGLKGVCCKRTEEAFCVPAEEQRSG